MLRKQGSRPDAIEAMKRAISIETRIQNRHLFLLESYKQLADDYMAVKDFKQAIACSQKIIKIEKDTSMHSYTMHLDYCPHETVLFTAEAYF